MRTLSDKTIGEIVARDYRTSVVFDRYGIDFCCKGGRTLRKACETRAFNTDKIEDELKAVISQSEQGDQIDFSSWPADLLIDYIEKTHHRYVRNQIPVLQGWLYKVSTVHGRNHPELFEIRDLFDESAKGMLQHMEREERDVFPYIRSLVNGKESIDIESSFETMDRAVQAMMDDHSDEGNRFARIAALTDGYTPPSDACRTYRVAFETLDDFEQDLHHHVHLENNILFPKAIELSEAY